jgi:hypothetical protein
MTRIHDILSNTDSYTRARAPRVCRRKTTKARAHAHDARMRTTTSQKRTAATRKITLQTKSKNHWQPNGDEQEGTERDDTATSMTTAATTTTAAARVSTRF